MGQKRLKRGKERQTCQSKKQHDKEKGNEASRKTQRRQKSNNDTGHKPSFVVLLSVFEKAFLIAMKVEAKTDITIRL